MGKTASVLDCLQPYYFHTHLVGSKGSLLDNKLHSEDLKSDKTEWSELSMKLVDSGDVADHPYQTQFEAFFDAMNKGKAMPHTSLDEAVLSHEIIFCGRSFCEEGQAGKDFPKSAIRGNRSLSQRTRLL